MTSKLEQDICDECEAFCCRHSVGRVLIKDNDTTYYFESRCSRNAPTKEKDGWMYFALDQPCPQLNEDFSCKIYEDRPKTCREFPPKEHGARWKDYCALYRHLYPEDN